MKGFVARNRSVSGLSTGSPIVHSVVDSRGPRSQDTAPAVTVMDTGAGPSIRQPGPQVDGDLVEVRSECRFRRRDRQVPDERHSAPVAPGPVAAAPPVRQRGRGCAARPGLMCCIRAGQARMGANNAAPTRRSARTSAMVSRFGTNESASAVGLGLLFGSLASELGNWWVSCYARIAMQHRSSQ